MKLTNGKETVVLHDEIQIKAFKNNGFEEVVVAAAPKKRKANNEDSDKN